eukprot:TRINITY_DN12062_c0_g1_i17.p5 TRINITY_DN12062_c0_g1~~TRINITY_DN12062_c0_g1_i17.p5  ORF type:complete len:238 (-),score=25.03 TRINITY_DN12062_c0_g1_i17:2374-3051(-)
MNGWLLGDISSIYGITRSTEECCDACKLNDECNGYNWCACRGGCSGYDYGTCILKTLPFPQVPINSISGANIKFLGGVPEITFVPSHTCQVSFPCSDTPEACSSEEFEDSVECPVEECNAHRANLQGETLIRDFTEETGIIVYTSAQCCSACMQTTGCNTWVYCNDPNGCSGYPYRLCSLKFQDFDASPPVKKENELSSWLSGYFYKEPVDILNTFVQKIKSTQD